MNTKAVETQNYCHDFLQQIVNLKSTKIILAFTSYVFLAM